MKIKATKKAPVKELLGDEVKLKYLILQLQEPQKNPIIS